MPSGECMRTVLYGKGASYQLPVELNDYICVVCVKGKVRGVEKYFIWEAIPIAQHCFSQ